MLIQRLKFVFFSILIVFNINISNAQKLDAQPIFDIGDKWTYRYHNTGDKKDPYLYTQQTYKSENGSGWVYVESQQLRAQRVQSVGRYDYKRGGFKERFEFNPLNENNLGNRYSENLSAVDYFQFPFYVGKKYAVKSDYANKKGYFEYDVEIQSFENIRVEAGAFDAYKIKFEGWWYNTVDDRGHGRSTLVHWFAPSVKRVIKTEYSDFRQSGTVFNSDTTELVKWEPKATLSKALPTMPQQAIGSMAVGKDAIAGQLASDKQKPIDNSPSKTVTQRLGELKELFDKGLITKEQHEYKSAEIIKDL